MTRVPIKVGGVRTQLAYDHNIPWRHVCHARIMALIYFKALHKGSVMPKDELIEDIWESHGPGITARVPEKYVESVRRLFIKEVAE